MIREKEWEWQEEIIESMNENKNKHIKMKNSKEKFEKARQILHTHWKTFGEGNVNFVEARKRSIHEILELILNSEDHYKDRMYWYDVLIQMEKL